MGGAHGWRSGKSRWEPVPGGPFDVGAQLRVAATVSASGDNPHVATRPAAARLTYRRARARSSRPTVVRPADGLGTRRPRDPDRPLVCQDETSKQLLAETRVPIPIKPARPARCDHEPNGTAVCLQVRKAHLDLLALVTGFGELRCTHPGARRITCVLMHVARDLSEGHIRGALGLERTWTAVAGARAIKDSPAIMHRPGCPEKLTLRADVEVVLPIEGKVRARQDAFFSLAHVPKQGCAV